MLSCLAESWRGGSHWTHLFPLSSSFIISFLFLLLFPLLVFSPRLPLLVLTKFHHPEPVASRLFYKQVYRTAQLSSVLSSTSLCTPSCFCDHFSLTGNGIRGSALLVCSDHSLSGLSNCFQAWVSKAREFPDNAELGKRVLSLSSWVGLVRLPQDTQKQVEGLTRHFEYSWLSWVLKRKRDLEKWVSEVL